MRTYLVAFLLAFVVAAVLTPVLRGMVSQIGGMDRAIGSRKVHTTAIPRIGGISIVLGFFAPLVGLFLWENDISALFLGEPSRVVGLFAGGLGIAALGLYDDCRGANARLKLSVQVIAAALLFELGFRIEAISNPFGGNAIPLGFLSWPLSVLWFVGVVNALNLIDGLDGLAAGVAAIAVGLTFAMAFNRPDVLMCLFMASLAGAILGFLLYNFNPATIFMGDTGSMFLGFVLAAASVTTSAKSSTAVALLVPVVTLGLPITDTLLAVLRRALRGRPVFSADHEHIHHMMLSKGFSQRRTVLLLYGVCLVLATMAFALTYASEPVAAATLTLLAGLGGVALRKLGYLELTIDGVRGLLADRERNRRLHRAVRGSLGALEAVREVDDLIVALAPVGLAVGAKSLTLSLKAAMSDETAATWRWTCAAGASASDQGPLARLPLRTEQTELASGELLVAWPSQTARIGDELEIAIEPIAREIDLTLRRIERERHTDGGGQPARPVSEPTGVSSAAPEAPVRITPV